MHRHREIVRLLICCASMSASVASAEGIYQARAVVHLRGAEPYTVECDLIANRSSKLSLQRPALSGVDFARDVVELPGKGESVTTGHDLQIMVTPRADRTVTCDIEWQFRAASRGRSDGVRITTTGVREIFPLKARQRQQLILERDVDDRPRTWIDFEVQAIDDQVYAVVYNTANLVIPVAGDDQEAKPDFGPLVAAICKNVEPAAWRDAGGECSITPLPQNLSVVVCATKDIHEEVSQLLTKLRREQDLPEPE